MPELPEVETVRASLADKLTGFRVIDARAHRRDVVVIPGDPRGGFARARTPRPRPRRLRREHLLVGARLVRFHRLGKQLAIEADDGRAIGVHLGMSGQLLVAGPEHDGATHIHASWRLDGEHRLLFRDPRRFGGLWCFPSMDELRRVRWTALGPDALDITAGVLRQRLARTARPIKAALLDQAIIAGVGNIYADEALFRASIHPARPASDLGSKETARLSASIRAILRAAVKARGSTLRDFVDPGGEPGGYRRAHAVYGRVAQPCMRCGRPLEGTRLAQRATVWCEACQPAMGSFPQTDP